MNGFVKPHSDNNKAIQLRVTVLGPICRQVVTLVSAAPFYEVQNSSSWRSMRQNRALELAMQEKA